MKKISFKVHGKSGSNPPTGFKNYAVSSVPVIGSRETDAVPEKTKKNKSLKILWTVLTIALFLFGLYLLLAPFLPELEYLFRPKVQQTASDNELSFVNDLIENTDNAISTDNNLKVKPDKIIIPIIGANVDLHYSSNDKALDLGAWLKSQGSLPGGTGNTIITGHKFVYYSGQRPFYHLYRVQPGDSIYIYWRGQTYYYKTTENFVVGENEVWIENQTADSILTIYTCEGLDSSQRRVIRAKFVETVTLPGTNGNQ